MKFTSKIALVLINIIAMPVYAVIDNSQQLQQQINQILVKQQQLQAQVVRLKKQIVAVQAKQQQVPQQFPLDITSNKPLARIGSYRGYGADISGDELEVKAPKILTDQALLLQRFQEESSAKKDKVPEEDMPYIVLSGIVEGQGVYSKTSGQSSGTDIDLSDAELYVNPVVNKWISGLAILAYDNNVDAYSVGDNRVAQSRIYLDRVFVTLGNFQYSPVYGSVGQMYVSFGQYAHQSVSDPLTQLLARTKARAVSVGYYQNQNNGFDTSAYVFQAAGGTQAQKSKLDNIGLDAAYHFSFDSGISGNAGMSYINNMANSQGMLDNGLSAATACDPDHPDECAFRGYGWQTKPLVKGVAGYDGHASVSYSQFTILGEYVTAAARFDARDLSFNTFSGNPHDVELPVGAEPRAFDAEAIYNFTAGTIPSSVVLNYDFTREALALALPKTSYGSTVNFDIWRDTVFSLECRHDIEYAKNTSATGGDQQSVVLVGNGLSDNVVTAQLDMYF